MITVAKPDPMSTRVREKLDRLHGVRRSYRLIDTIAWSAALLIFTTAIALALDAAIGWWSKPIRSLVSATVITTAAAALIIGLRRILSPRRDMELARIADSHTPSLEERLQTVMSTSHDIRSDLASSRGGFDPIMFDLVASETETLVNDLKPEEAARERSLRWPCLIATLGIIGCMLVTTQVGSDIRVLAKRLLAPTADITRHQLQGIPGDQVIASDETWELQLTASGPPIATVGVERVIDRKPKSKAPASDAPLTVHESVTLSPTRGTDNQFQYRQRRASDSFRYRLTAGDLRTPWHSVIVADRPRITSVALKITPPAYAHLKPTSHRRLPNRLTVIEGSTIEVTVTGAGNVDQAMLLIDGQSPRVMWSDNGRIFRVSMVVDSEIVLSPQLLEPHGLTNLRSPNCRILTRRDLPPTVRIKTPRPEQKVRPNDTVTLTFQAKDDVGLAKARLVIESESDDSTVETLDVIDLPVPLNDGEPIKKWDGKTQIDLSQYGLSEGQSLRYRIEAYDTKQSAILENTQQPIKKEPPASPSTSATNTPAPTDNIESGADTGSSQYPISPDNSSRNTLDEMAQTRAEKNSLTNETNSSSGNESDEETAPPTSLSSENESMSSEGESSAAAQNADRPTDNQTDQRQQQVGFATGGETDPEPNNGSSQPASTDTPPANSQPGNSPKTEPDSIAPEPDASSPNEASMKDAEKRNTASDEPDADEENSLDSSPGQKSSTDNSTPQNSSSSGPKLSPPPTPDKDNSEQDSETPSSSNDDKMTRRGLDVPQPSSSQQMRLQITETIGSFQGTARRKTEIAVAGTIHRVEDELKQAREILSNVLEAQTQNEPWDDDLQVNVNEAHSHLQSAIDAVKSLLARTKGTPYAFIGVQLAEITHTHIRPAEQDAASVVDVTGDTRKALLMASRQQTVRAIDRLAALYQTFEKAKSDFDKADDVQQIQKMYRVYLEDSLAELTKATKDDPDGLKRTMAELDVDEDYLERLQEVLKMQNELRAELARLLADDPRLMRRYFQNFGEKGQTIRSQLFALAERQSTLHESLSQYANTESEDRMEALLLQHATEFATESLDLVQRAFEIEETFETWLPLQNNESASVSATRDAFLDSTSTAAMITSHYETAPGSTLLMGEATWSSARNALLAVSESMVSLIESLDRVATQLGALAQSDDRYAANALRRIVELGEMRESAARWNQKVRFLSEKQFAPAIGVDQSTIAIDTHTLTEKLTGLQGELASTLGGNGTALPKSIAERCDLLLAKLDRDIEPIQLAAIRSLQRSLIDKAAVRTRVASESLDDACRLMDDVLKAVIERLDELPPDPLADLLDDPTLDEILAILEQERDLAELLGIPNRPTNLQIVNDWANGGKGPGGAGRARLIAMIRAAMKAEGKKSDKALERIRQKLMASTRSDENETAETEQRRGGAFGWNIVRSQLGSGLLQGSDGLPPEAYRRSIDRYFELISGSIDMTDPEQ